jgi:4-hydroxy 2-oxovalerate aldolase
MSNIRILDCTLRDGGYINDWKFGKKTIKGIINHLAEANIDIIETGFIRHVDHRDDTSVFSSVDQIAELIAPKKANTLYAVMIEQHNHADDLISEYDGRSVDLVRITFRRNEWEEAKESVKRIMAKGYKVCVQPVGTATYDDQSLLNLIKDVNQLKPYAFYLVDTLGMMYIHDMRRFYYLIDNNLSNNICLGFHSHNNLQMSFANAQEIIQLSHKRKLIIDSSCYGMGRGAGNLTTELIADYINNNVDQRYYLTPILCIIDKYLKSVFAEKRWGYDVPLFLSATVRCHPNYAIYLMKKETIGIEKIEKLLSLIPNENRSEFNENLIERLYLQLQAYEIDDTSAFIELESMVKDRKVLLLGSGSSIEKYKTIISKATEDTVVISINYLPEDFRVDAVFVSNEKRLEAIGLGSAKTVLATSNLNRIIQKGLFFNYSSLLGEGDASDNAGAMLIRILSKAGAKKLFLAGFDGFDVDSTANFVVPEFRTTLDYDAAKKKNEDISRQLMLALRGVDYGLLTPTKYSIGDI